MITNNDTVFTVRERLASPIYSLVKIICYLNIVILIIIVSGCAGHKVLQEAPPLQKTAPEIKTGFYQVFQINSDTIVSEVGDNYFGKMVYLYLDEYLEEENRFLGIHGVFLPDGKFYSEMKNNKVHHIWESDDFEGEVVFNQIDDSLLVATITPKGKSRYKIALMFFKKVLPGAEVDTKFIAHRGTCYQPPTNTEGIYPSNTIPAFEAALRAGFQGFELDVRVTKDKRFIVSHDEDLSVATDCSGSVNEFDLGELGNCLVHRSTFIPEFRPTAANAYIAAPLPTLEKVLQIFLKDDRTETIVVDIKPDSNENILAAAKNEFSGLSKEEQDKLIFLTRSEGVAAGLKKIIPEAIIAVEGSKGTEPLSEPEIYFPESKGLPRKPHNAISLNTRLMMLFFRYQKSLNEMEDVIELAREYDYKVIAWTISTEGRMDKLRERDLFPDYALTDAPYYILALEEMRYYLQKNLENIRAQ
jgi:glycerophosphoryl diester phosphodiesterase